MHVFKELIGFIKRNGIKSILIHALEIYVGFLFRYLPGIEGLFLRGLFYRMIFASCGKNLIIYPNVYIIFSHKISVGQRVAFNVGTYIDGRGELSIGNHVMIGPNCVIATAGHSFNRTDIPMSQQPVEYGKIIIEDDVWLGANVVIKPGVKIGKGCIIAAGAIVVKDLSAYGIYGGVPAKLISQRKISG